MGTRPSKLNEAQKVDVVLRLAGYDSPSAIARSLKEEYAISIQPSSVALYDPTTYVGRHCPERWATLFYETRAKIVAGLSDIGATNKMVRMRWLDQMARKQMAADNSTEARALLRQAAEEMGEGVTYRHGHHGAFHYGDLSEAEIAARIAAVAGRLGLRPCEPDRARISGGGAGAGEEPQPPGEPLSG